MSAGGDERASAGAGRFAIIAALSLAHELPSTILGQVVPTVFTARLGLPVSQLWVFSIPLVVTALKWLWAPLVDAYGSDRFGRRRSWIVPSAFVVTIFYAIVALIQPSLATLPVLITLFVLVKIAFSTYEIATDAYVVEAVDAQQRGLGSSAVWLGKEFGQILGLAGTFIIVDRYGWTAAFMAVGIAFSLTVLAVLLKRERPQSDEALAARAAGRRAQVWHYLREPVNRRVLLLTFFFAFAVQMVPATIGPFLASRGLSLSEVGIAIGLAASLGAGLSLAAASAVVHRIGPKRTSIILIPIGLLALPLFLWLAASENPPLGLVVGTVFLGSVCTAPVRMAFYAARMGWTSPSQIGTDFTTQQSVWFIGYAVSIGVSGLLASTVGWFGFFVINALLTCTAIVIFVMSFNDIDRKIAALNEPNSAAVG
ncbi:MAG: MFS transporter [Pseudomonadota bacterium]